MYFQSHLPIHLSSTNIQSLARQTDVARSTLVRLKDGESQGKIVRLDCQVARKLMVALSCQFKELFTYIYKDSDCTGEVPIIKLSGTLKFYSQLPEILKTQGQSQENFEALSERLGIGWGTLRLYLNTDPLTILDARTIGKIVSTYETSLFPLIKII